jgi:hypothetical protein
VGCVRDTVFRQAALLRLREAEILLRHDPSYPSGAIYLGGYAVECLFKYRICRVARVRYLDDIPDRDRAARLLSARGHDLELLAVESQCWPAIRADGDLIRHFDNLKNWSVRLRYKADAGSFQYATKFLASARRMVRWLEARAEG